ncbi:hypothetical protein PFAG_03994 [Plasmodium falciparum Santa Lucia]|uniref:Uncharacterized protein n=2 Tax=Plasmodium falciparum TaxID=5833 RepID=W7FM15_PLAFA|nr:hypothetical protein PFNF135_04149 [Plasmodium falciparum NF135/5.C10]EUT82619.1 hypothetical protein PFAG_03994 [Plasmodium falciparum Santa Lucia]
MKDNEFVGGKLKLKKDIFKKDDKKGKKQKKDKNNKKESELIEKKKKKAQRKIMYMKIMIKIKMLKN